MKLKLKLKPKNCLVRLDETGYFSSDYAWRTVPIELAERMTRKDATKTWNRMFHRYFPQATIEDINE